MVERSCLASPFGELSEQDERQQAIKATVAAEKTEWRVMTVLYGEVVDEYGKMGGIIPPAEVDGSASAGGIPTTKSVSFDGGRVGCDDSEDVFPVRIYAGDGGDAAILFGGFNGRVSHCDESEVGGGFGCACAAAPGSRGGDGIGGVGVDDADGAFGDSSAAAEE